MFEHISLYSDLIIYEFLNGEVFFSEFVFDLGFFLLIYLIKHNIYIIFFTKGDLIIPIFKLCMR